MSEINLMAWCLAWSELQSWGANVEDSYVGGYDDLYPTDEMGGEG